MLVSRSQPSFSSLMRCKASPALRLLNVWIDEIDFLVRWETEYGLKSLRSKQLRGLIEQVLVAGV